LGVASKASGAEKQTRRLAEKVGAVTGDQWCLDKKNPHDLFVKCFFVGFGFLFRCGCGHWNNNFFLTLMFVIALPCSEAPNQNRRENTNKIVFPGLDFLLRC